MKSYLVTGGCGFIGVNLVSRLVARGDRVRVLDNLSMGQREDIESCDVQLLVGDVREMADAARATDGVDVVVHLAAHTRVTDSLACPELNFQVNAAGTLNVLRASLGAGASKFIFASTGGAILGEQPPPIHEEMVPKPKSPYGASKLAGEAYCSAYHGAFGLNTVALRFSNVYGAYSYHKGSVVAQFFRNLMQQEPVVIYGDGEQTRDFVYVDDLVDAILLADKIDTPGEVFQIASGRETSIIQLVEMMREMLGKQDVKVQHKPAQAGEIYRNFASIEKARRMLGYSPKIGLRDGLARTWDWFLSRSGAFTVNNWAQQ